MKGLLLVVIMFIFLSCTNERSCVNNSIISLHSTLSTTEVNNKSAISYKYRLIPLETSDMALMSEPIIVEIKDSILFIKDQNVLYFFSLLDGKFISKLDKKGVGPYEYLHISDVIFSSENKRLYLFDMRSNHLIIYSDKGEPIDQIKNDSIASIGMDNQGRFVVTYHQYNKKGNHLVGIYDEDFNYISSFLTNNSMEGMNVNLHKVNPVYTFNGNSYVYIQDSLYAIVNQKPELALVIDKGDYKIPDDVESNVERRAERDGYIWGDYGYLVDKYYYYSFNYNKKTFFDLWDSRNAQLVARRVIDDYRQPTGIPFNINGHTVYVWPKYVRDNKLYCILNAEQALLVFPSYDEYNDNPIVLELTMM